MVGQAFLECFPDSGSYVNDNTPLRPNKQRTPIFYNLLHTRLKQKITFAPLPSMIELMEQKTVGDLRKVINNTLERQKRLQH